MVNCLNKIIFVKAETNAIAQEKHIVIIKTLIHIERSSLEERSLDSDPNICGSIPDFAEMDMVLGMPFLYIIGGRARLRFQ